MNRNPEMDQNKKEQNPEMDQHAEIDQNSKSRNGSRLDLFRRG